MLKTYNYLIDSSHDIRIVGIMEKDNKCCQQKGRKRSMKQVSLMRMNFNFILNQEI